MKTCPPRHLGIILDGNRRWARDHELPTVGDGHRAGFAKIPDVLSWCDELGIGVVTLWMLSDLYAIITDVTRKLIAEDRWRLHPIGRLDLLPPALASLLRTAEESTRSADGMLVNLALAYGGRSDVLTAVRAVVDDVLAGRTAHVSEEHLARHLDTVGQPDPDLIIRPSGVLRSSGFLLWQAALAEYWFTDRLWPDFTLADLHEALAAYSGRERRLGS